MMGSQCREIEKIKREIGKNLGINDVEIRLGVGNPTSAENTEEPLSDPGPESPEVNIPHTEQEPS